jgi:predicted nucleic acid-binding protein
MKIVVDANVVIAALVKPSITREVLLYPYIDCYSPDFLLEEIDEHEEEISTKVGKGYKSAMRLISKKLVILPIYFYESNMQEAHKIIGAIDRDDEQYIALALSLGADGIWSYDDDFKKQHKISTFSTNDLLLLIKKGIL